MTNTLLRAVNSSAKKIRFLRLDYLPLAIIMVVNALFLSFNAFRCFNFFDMGSFLDAGWRVYQGQLPYRDFIYFTGPIHLYLHALSFVIFGFGKVAILAHMITLGSIVTFLVYWFTKKHASIFVATFSAMLSAVSFYWPISHPWYDQSAHFWVIIAIGIILLRDPLKSEKNLRQDGFWCGLLCAFSFFTKTNIGALYVGSFLLVFAAMPKRLTAIASYASGLVAGLAANLLIVRTPALYYEQVFVDFGYDNVSRLTDLLSPANWAIGNYWLMSILVISSFVLGNKKVLWQVILFFTMVLSAIGSAISASMIREVNIPTQGVLMALTFIMISNQPQQSLRELAIRHKVLLFLATILCTYLIVTGVRYGNELKVWTYIGKPPMGNYSIKTEAMRGWMCDHVWGKDLDSMAEFIDQNIPKKESLLILSDMQILYPLTNRESYKGVPFIFTQGKMPSQGRQLDRVRQHIMDKPPDWIITHLNYSFNITFIIQYLNLFDFLQNNYDPVHRWDQYALLKKKMLF